MEVHAWGWTPEKQRAWQNLTRGAVRYADARTLTSVVAAMAELGAALILEAKEEADTKNNAVRGPAAGNGAGIRMHQQDAATHGLTCWPAPVLPTTAMIMVAPTARDSYLIAPPLRLQLTVPECHHRLRSAGGPREARPGQVQDHHQGGGAARRPVQNRCVQGARGVCVFVCVGGGGHHTALAGLATGQ